MLVDPKYYLPRTGVLPMTGALTVANVTGALNSGAYSLQFRSGIADGAGAVGYIFDTANALLNATAKPYEFRTGGRGIVALRFEPGGGLFGNDAAVFDASILDAGTDVFGALKFITPGSLGQVDFRAPGAVFGIGINPGGAGFYTTRSGLAGDAAFLNFAYAGGANSFLVMSRDLSSSPATSIYPGQIDITLGLNIGNNNINKWGEAYWADNRYINFGNNADARIGWNATDLIINPDFKAAGGRLRINSASSWSAVGGGTAPALHANLPTGFVGTNQRWMICKDDTGAVFAIPAWSQL